MLADVGVEDPPRRAVEQRRVAVVHLEPAAAVVEDHAGHDLLAEVLHEAVGAEVQRARMSRAHQARAAGLVKSMSADVPPKSCRRDRGAAAVRATTPRRSASSNRPVASVPATSLATKARK